MVHGNKMFGERFSHHDSSRHFIRLSFDCRSAFVDGRFVTILSFLLVSSTIFF